MKSLSRRFWLWVARKIREVEYLEFDGLADLVDDGVAVVEYDSLERTSYSNYTDSIKKGYNEPQ